MEHRSHYTSRRQEKPQELMNPRRWDVKGRIMRCPNTNSGRILGTNSYNVTSFREDILGSSFRSNITISSTASSPGFLSKDEIDPATYSFTAALKALQPRSGRYGWESSSSERFALNSKWNDAERFICNPLSGEVPMECLSAKTLGQRAFKDITNQINNMPTRIGGLCPSHKSNTMNLKLAHAAQENLAPLTIQGKKTLEKGWVKTTRDVGIQSTTPKLTSRAISSPSSLRTSPSASPSPSTSPASTPSIGEKLLKPSEETLSSSSMIDSTDKVVEVKMEGGREEGEEESKRDVESPEHKTANSKVLCRWAHGGGCLSWMSKKSKKEYMPRKRNTFLTYFRGC